MTMVSCIGVDHHKSENKWKWLALFLPQSNAADKVTMNVTLVGADGKPMSISGTSTRSASSTLESEKPASDSTVGSAGSAGDKAGGETLDVTFNGSAKAIEVMDSSGSYAGTITVTPRTGSETYTNSFLSFMLKSDAEPAAGAISGVITGEVIVVEVPFQDTTKLTAIYTTDGANVTVGGVNQVTGRTVNDFSQSLTYTVVARNGSEKKYNVVVKRKYYTCELAGFYFTDYPLTAVSQKSDASSTWYEAVLPPDVSLTALKTSFSIYGTSMTVSGISQVSGVSTQNFNGVSVVYTINGSNGCSQTYTVKATNEVLKTANAKMAKSAVQARGTLDLEDFPEVTKVGAAGIPKTVSSIELKPFGYFDDVVGEYVFTTGQIILMVPYGTSFENINLEIETKNNTKQVLVDGSSFVRGSTIAKFSQRNGSEKHTVDIKLIDKFSAFEVPYTIQIVMGAPPPFVAVSKDSTFMLFVNSTAAAARDNSNDVAEIIKWFAPFYNSGSAISDLKTVLAIVNEAKISVARWTVDPGKVELNIIGQGFRIFDFDIESYEEDLKCFKYPFAVWQKDGEFRWGADLLIYWLNRDAILRSLHSGHCGKSKGNEQYPNYKKNYPYLSNYGRIVNNAKQIDAYGVKVENLNPENDSAYFSTNLIYQVPSMNQFANVFTLNTVRGKPVLYELPAVNYIEKMEPNNGTIGTEVKVTFAATVEPEVYTVTCTMDNQPVLNLRTNDSRSVSFNVPNISRGSRIACEKMPIVKDKGNRFVMISTEAFIMKPYTPLAGFSYPTDSMNFVVGENQNILPSVRAGRINYTYITSGKLPYGLYLLRGRIMGRVVAETPASEITMVASDGYTNETIKLKISTSPAVIVKPPVINYPSSGYFLLVGKKFNISPISEKLPGIQYMINKPLPTGVSFDRETGIISGYPVSTLSATTYVISAANEVGFAKFNLTLQINPDRTGFSPPTLSFSGTSYTVTKGQAISLMPTVTGSQPYQFNASGLPEGMSIDSDTGVISGTPVSVTPESQAYVTIQNYAGNVKLPLKFTVTTTPSPAPSSLTFSATNYTFTSGVLISAVTPSYTGILSNCTSTPSLPTGLTLSSTCSISGTPTVSQAFTYYTISGSNSSGSTTATIGITVGNFPPSALTYSSASYNFSHNAAITVITPTFSGGVTSCTSSPTLPTGLSINPSTCAIGGTPTLIQGNVNYTITATNAYGSTTANLSMSVATVPPSGLTYLGSPYTWNLPGPVSTGIPALAGSPLSSCTISPALPAGLTINNSNCMVSGSPTDPIPLSNYTITATNAAGSTTANISFRILATYNFTSAGAFGRSGPTQTQTNTAYAGTSLAGKVTTTGGIQRFVVPLTATYNIEVYGAQGATNDSNYGRGAILKSSIALNAGDVLWILVGQQGLYNGTCGAYNQAGGGGGTFVTKGATMGTSTPILIAGGGGGACWYAHYAGFYDSAFYYAHATTSTSANSGQYFTGGACGVGGSGGSAGGIDPDPSYPTQFDASAGWLSSGTSSKTFYAGGLGTLSDPVGADGGFGGGGSSFVWVSEGKAGGGGGYSGGGSGCHNNGDVGSGGGGGSFSTGSLYFTGSASSGNVGAGKVVIIYQ